MRALTLRQPWASLVACGAKSIETRSWKAPASAIGQRLLIHAGKACDDTALLDAAIRGPLVKAGYEASWWPGHLDAARFDAGVVASCQLVDVQPIERMAICIDVGARGWGIQSIGDVLLVDPDQLPFGDFSPGRWAWLLDDVKPTTERCPRCWGAPEWPTDHRIEGGSKSCWYCNRTFTFNFMRDEGPFHCDCRGAAHAACPTCDAKGSCEPVPMRGKQGLWNVDFAPLNASGPK